MRGQASKIAFIVLGLGWFVTGDAVAQAGEATPPAKTVPKLVPPAPVKSDAAKKKSASTQKAKPPLPDIVGNYGQWALVCAKPKTDAAKTTCSLVQALVERETQKLLFRVMFRYGPKGNLVLQIDGPTGVALQRGLEFSPDAKKIYRMPFQTCIPQACRAVLIVPEDLKSELQKAEKGTIAVYSLNGQPVQTVTDLTGFSAGLAALDKRRAAQ
jgi:invasion protein IalB